MPPDTHQLPIGAPAQSPAENAGKTCGRAILEATLQIFMGFASSWWWPTSDKLLDRREGVVYKIPLPPLQGRAGRRVDDAKAFP